VAALKTDKARKNAFPIRLWSKFSFQTNMKCHEVSCSGNSGDSDRDDSGSDSDDMTVVTVVTVVTAVVLVGNVVTVAVVTVICCGSRDHQNVLTSLSRYPLPNSVKSLV
jgi:hypothetical protein